MVSTFDIAICNMDHQVHFYMSRNILLYDIFLSLGGLIELLLKAVAMVLLLLTLRKLIKQPQLNLKFQ